MGRRLSRCGCRPVPGRRRPGRVTISAGASAFATGLRAPVAVDARRHIAAGDAAKLSDPTKAGYSSISINGVAGRTPRIEVDGLDISDENVGTTTQNISLSSIQEFNISRSNLDLSTELTSAGAVNVATRSGSNALHGMGFYDFGVFHYLGGLQDALHPPVEHRHDVR